ncbi:MAG: hypothetical protein HOF77_03285 [Actinobacteria bacterium]|jgi:hypothetical protein|nr:hypothetical protein [Actinomycetota bacterium]|tara:strand:+ start:538 stop:804 length:267 start_codon:yes stop_codon:yes gene_type:complete
MNDRGIRALYANVVSITETSDGVSCTDANGDPVTIDQDAVDAWVDPEGYKFKRQDEYPSIINQLDDIYHNGVSGWKTSIKAVKDKYPK